MTVEKIFTWVVALIVAAVLGLLSASSFLGWEHGQNGNRIIAMLIDLQRFLVGLVGGPVTGVLFALAAVGILWLAFTSRSTPRPG